MNYLKRYYKVISVLMVVLLIILLMFNKTTIKTDGYSVDNVYNNTTKELSSDKYMGRRFGNKENMDAIKYVDSNASMLAQKNMKVRLCHSERSGEFCREFLQDPSLRSG